MQAAVGGGLPLFALSNGYRIKFTSVQSDGPLYLAISGSINVGNLDLFLSDLSCFRRKDKRLMLDLKDVLSVDESAANALVKFTAISNSSMINTPLYLQQLLRSLSETK